jgi:hypothetical protein
MQGTVCRLVLLVLLVGASQAGAVTIGETNFHMPTRLVGLETGYTLGNGEGQLGFGYCGVGIQDRFELGTDLILDAATLVNVKGKVSLLHEEEGMPAVAVGGSYFNAVWLDEAVNIAIEEALAEEDEDVSFIAEVWGYTLFGSLSKALGANDLHVHAGYQLKHIQGKAESEEPFEVGGEPGDSDILLEIDDEITAHNVLAGISKIVGENLMLMGEAGYDLTYEEARFGGGLLFRFGSIYMQLGAQYPGIEIEDFDFPVIPSFYVVGRF